MRRLAASFRRIATTAVLVTAVSALLGCGAGAATPSVRIPATAAPTPRAPDIAPPTLPAVSAVPPAANEVPPAILEAVQAEAARLASLPVEQLSLVRADEITWPDGSLGCPKPGEMYTQSLVHGFWIVFDSGSETYDFRAASDGSFFRCELSRPPGISPS
jgi:hypothetical protein